MAGSGTDTAWRNALQGMSERAALRYGLLLAALLAGALAAILVHDRTSRLSSAERETATVARAAASLIHHGMRDVERVLLTVARGSERRLGRLEDQGARLSNVEIDELVADRDELDAIVVHDLQGRALSPGADDPDLPGWVAGAATVPGSPMRFGAPRRAAHGGWVVPLAVPLPGSRPGWVVGTYRLSALQEVVTTVAAGERRLISVFDSNRYVLARTLSPDVMVGTRSNDPDLVRRVADGAPHLVDIDRTTRDNVDRIRAHHPIDRYPLYVGAGQPLADVLWPWYLLAGLLLCGYALFWAGFLHLLAIIRRNSRQQAELLDQIGRGAELLTVAQRAGRMGSWAYLNDGTLWWSEEVPRLYGLPAQKGVLEEGTFLAMIVPEDRDAVVDTLASLPEAGNVTVDYRVRLPDGSLRHLSTRGARVQTPGSDIRMSGVVMDVTDSVLAQQRLLDAERQFRATFDRNPLPFWVFDSATLRFLEVNQAAVRNYGFSRDEFLSMGLPDIRPPEEMPRLLENLRRYRDQPSPPDVWTHQRKDGSLIEVRVHAADIEFCGRPARLVLAEDVGERLQAQREMHYRATHDLLTGLPNETVFRQSLEAMIGTARGEGIHVARIVLQRHSLLADSLGMAAADEVLVQAATRLRQLAGEHGLAARLPGAEFIVALPAPAGDGNGSTLLGLLAHTLDEPVWGADATHYLDPSLGLAIHPADGASADELVRNAGLAVHNVVRQLSPEGMRYSPGLARRMAERLGMLGRLHEAIEQQRFQLHFQPIFDLGSGQVSSYEALARWPQPDGSWVPPGEFIPLCEESAMIVPFGRWVLHEAARAWLAFAAAGHPPRPIAVNVSVPQFSRSDLVAELRTVIATHGVPAEAIELELTEGVVMSDPEHVIRTLGELRAMGARLAIDDFGTGYSNMAYLRRLPVHTLKIDRVFVQDIENDGTNAAICRSVMALASLFGLCVTAEGIETQAQLDWFRDNGGHLAQGYLLGRPAPLATLLGTPPVAPGVSGTPRVRCGAGDAPSSAQSA